MWDDDVHYKTMYEYLFFNFLFHKQSIKILNTFRTSEKLNFNYLSIKIQQFERRDTNIISKWIGTATLASSIVRYWFYWFAIDGPAAFHLSFFSVCSELYRRLTSLATKFSNTKPLVSMKFAHDLVTDASRIPLASRTFRVNVYLSSYLQTKKKKWGQLVLWLLSFFAICLLFHFGAGLPCSWVGAIVLFCHRKNASFTERCVQRQNAHEEEIRGHAANQHWSVKHGKRKAIVNYIHICHIWWLFNVYSLRLWEWITIVPAQGQQCYTNSQAANKQPTVHQSKAFTGIWFVQQGAFHGIIDGMFHRWTVPFVDVHNLKTNAEAVSWRYLYTTMLWRVSSDVVRLADYNRFSAKYAPQPPFPSGFSRLSWLL